MCKTTINSGEKLMKTNKMRDIPCSWVRKLNIVKVSAFFQIHYRFNKTSMKIKTRYFVEIEKLRLKFIWKWEGLKIVKHF